MVKEEIIHLSLSILSDEVNDSLVEAATEHARDFAWHHGRWILRDGVMGLSLGPYVKLVWEAYR